MSPRAKAPTTLSGMMCRHEIDRLHFGRLFGEAGDGGGVGLAADAGARL